MNWKEIHDRWTTGIPEKDPCDELPDHAPLKCPFCGALALELWMISGLTYYKCSHCGKKA